MISLSPTQPVAFISDGTASIAVVNTASDNITRSIPVITGAGQTLAVTPDGSLLYATGTVKTEYLFGAMIDTNTFATVPFPGIGAIVIHLLRICELVRGATRNPVQKENNMTLSSIVEQVQVMGSDLVAHVNRLIKEGNVRRIVIRDEHGHTFMEIPVTVAAVGVIAAPLAAALGTLAAMVAKFTIIVERNTPTA